MPSHPLTIFILSGGAGFSGEYLVNTVLAQYPEARVRLLTQGSLRREAQVREALAQAKESQALVVHTFVDQALRGVVIEGAARLGLEAIDLSGPLFDWLTPALGQAPAGQPGLYRQLHQQYFERVSAIDYSMAHDDGKHPEGWAQADIMLVGVSRAGKTPLSLYLAVLGWKVANYPLVPQIPVSQALFDLDPARVFGVNIDLQQLMLYRMKRQAGLGVSGPSAYVDPEAVEEELREAKRLFRRHGFKVINMTDKTIEMGADEILQRVEGRR